MADYKVPGVYVEEPFGLSLSIQTGATAIPAFALDGDVNHNAALFNTNQVAEIASWLTIVTLIQEKIDSAVKHIHVTNDQERWLKKRMVDVLTRNWDVRLSPDPLYHALKLYFINGGGPCYVVPVDQLASVVPGLDDVTLLVQAGADTSSFAKQVTALCTTGNPYFAIYDGPEKPMAADAVAKSVEHYAGGAFAAVYYPWLNVTLPDPTDAEKTIQVTVPPSGAVAGAYAKVDRERGVWKAPANVAIVGAQPAVKVSDAVNAACNVPEGGRAINVIRSFQGAAPMIWGARTLQADQDTWRYVPVRRLFNAAEHDIRLAMSTALFEPNSAPTWERVRSAVANYVDSLWRQGALAGNTAQEAYFVHIGRGVTMTDEDIKTGKMIVKVGMSAVRPAEFIVLRLTQDVVPA